jgi:hypothetical protein
LQYDPIAERFEALTREIVSLRQTVAQLRGSGAGRTISHPKEALW